MENHQKIMNLGILAYRWSWDFMNSLKAKIHEKGLTLTKQELVIVNFVYFTKSNSVSDLAVALDLKKSNISKTVSKLIDMGYFTYEASTVDKRKKFLIPNQEKLEILHQAKLELFTVVKENIGLENLELFSEILSSSSNIEF